MSVTFHVLRHAVVAAGAAEDPEQHGARGLPVHRVLGWVGPLLLLNLRPNMVRHSSILLKKMWPRLIEFVSKDQAS